MSAVPPNFYKAFLAQKLSVGTAASVIYIDRLTTLQGELVATGDFADLGRGVLTIQPEADGLTDYPENISFTAVDSVNIAFTGAIRGLNKSGSSQTALMRFYPVGTPVIISVGNQQIADILAYINNAIAAAVFGTSLTVVASAGETVSQGNLVYLKNDGLWWKTDADLPATIDGVQMGIAQGAGTASNAIAGGVMLKGLDTHQSGLVAGTTYYVSNTAGAISASVGTTTKAIGVAKSTSSIFFDPLYANTPTSTQNAFLSAVTGQIIMYGNATPPAGFLAADGSAVSRTTQANLFAVIGTSFGVGDGSTTFNLPDLRGSVPVGSGTKTKVATFASRASNVLTVTGLSNAANNEFQTGQVITYHSTSTVIAGLTNDTVYYLIRTGNLTFSLATTLALAQVGTPIALSSDGAGVQTFTLTLTARTIGHSGGEETHAQARGEESPHVHSVTATASSISNQSFSPGNNTTGSTFTGNTNSSPGGVATNNMQPFAVITYMIKT